MEEFRLISFKDILSISSVLKAQWRLCNIRHLFLSYSVLLYDFFPGQPWKIKTWTHDTTKNQHTYNMEVFLTIKRDKTAIFLDFKETATVTDLKKVQLFGLYFSERFLRTKVLKISHSAENFVCRNILLA